MPPSDDLRNELAAISPKSDCDRLAELSGLFHVAGSVHLRGRGEVVTYGELAALAGAPGAARAAGSFCGRSRLGLFVPCHRVVAAGGLGSYGSYGVAYKKRLLQLEGALGAL